MILSFDVGDLRPLLLFFDGRSRAEPHYAAPGSGASLTRVKEKPVLGCARRTV